MSSLPTARKETTRSPSPAASRSRRGSTAAPATTSSSADRFRISSSAAAAATSSAAARPAIFSWEVAATTSSSAVGGGTCSSAAWGATPSSAAAATICSSAEPPATTKMTRPCWPFSPSGPPSGRWAHASPTWRAAMAPATGPTATISSGAATRCRDWRPPHRALAAGWSAWCRTGRSHRGGSAARLAPGTAATCFLKTARFGF